MQVINDENKNEQDKEKLMRQKVQDDTLRKLYRKNMEDQATRMAARHGLSYLDLNTIPVSAEALSAVPEETARRAKLAVIYRVGKKYQVAVQDPANPETQAVIKSLEENDGASCTVVVISEESLEKAWNSYKIRNFTDTFEERGVHLKEADLTDFEKGISGLIDLKKRITEINTTEIFNVIVAGAVKTNASDIHIEPEKEAVRLRYRIDGVLQDIVRFPKNVHKTIISRIKMLASMKLNVTDVPQDGNFNVSLDNMALNIRVSVLPAAYGESVVMRVLTENSQGVQLGKIGFNQYYMEQVQEQISKPNGMILTTGPTGSGKTTTLYSFIQSINTPGVKVITLENPIEYRVAGVTQTQVEQNEEFTFAQALKSVVRQDPDIIMVGEIRDKETAETAIQAALTGHLVLSTLHTNDAAGAIPRLLHLGVNPALIAPAVNAVIGQRLVRRLCEHCKEAYVPAQEILVALQNAVGKIPKNKSMQLPTNITQLYRSHGCSKCNFIGYTGRIGVYEVFTMTPAIEKIILANVASADMKNAARTDGMISMAEDGLLKALAGITTLEEVFRVTGENFATGHLSVH